MTAVPKPLKFLRPHYDELAELYEKWAEGADKVGIAVQHPSIMLNNGIPRSPSQTLFRFWE